MKIEKIEIYGYGKWTQATFTDLKDLQIFLGSNEAGKSTIASFIHTIFFGFPSRRKKDTNTYEPKLGERYGGRLTLSNTRFGNVTIERIKNRDRDRATLTHQNGVQEIVENLPRYLLGVDSATYDDLYTFQIDRLLHLRHVKKEELNRYLMGIGATGSELFLNLADGYRKEGQKEFKPSGKNPELNKKLAETEKLWEQLQVAKRKNNEYQTLLLRLESIQEKLQQGNEQITGFERENRELSEAIRLGDYYQEWLQLSEKIEAVDTRFLPPDAAKRWERLQTAITDDLKRLSAVNAQIQNEQKVYAAFTNAIWYDEHRHDWHALQDAYTKTQDLFTNAYALTNQMNQEEAALVMFKRQYGFGDNMVKVDAENEAIIRELLAEEEKIAGQIELVNQRIATCYTELDSLEKRIKEVTGKSETIKPQVTPTNKAKFAWWGLAIAALLVAVLLPSLRIYALLVAAVAVGASFVKPKPPTETEAYIAQQTRESRLRDLREDEEAAQERLLQFLNEQEALETKMEQLQEQQRTWLVEAHYPTSFSLRRVLEENPAVQLENLETNLARTVARLEEVELSLADWQTRTEFIREHFQLNHLEPKMFFERFPELHRKLEVERTQAKNSSDKISDLKVERKEIQNRLDEINAKRQTMLDNANVENEAEFYQLMQAKEEQAKQKQRRDFLAEQLAGKERLLERYPDKQKAENKLLKNQSQIRSFQENRTALQEEEVSLRHEISILEDGGTYSSLLQEYAILETEVYDLIVEWGKKIVAAEWLEDTLRHGKEDRLPHILEDMIAYFVRLTEGAYTQIVFQKSGLKIRRKDGTVFEPFELSQGTIEQLYIAMRFAFIKNTADIANLPILVDDGFVNFDVKRKGVVYELLGELSDKVQVFFFTFDRTVTEKFSSEQISVLN
ncbi:AAA family ATPase [Jeotgalibaca sp. A122]|uniref:AAA family ATPase n=1 Tax=Jeotgalibaca sp. A122 TaxID=3457322 RepID=UPI003FD5F4BB